MSRNFKVGLFVTVAILTTTFSFYFWQIFRTPNIQLDKQTSFALLIPENATYQTVLDTLNKHDVITDHISFRFLAKLLNYPGKVKPGR